LFRGNAGQAAMPQLIRACGGPDRFEEIKGVDIAICHSTSIVVEWQATLLAAFARSTASPISLYRLEASRSQCSMNNST
jgi:hypothetical protein